jgi:hypothetical protein
MLRAFPYFENRSALRASRFYLHSATIHRIPIDALRRFGWDQPDAEEFSSNGFTDVANEIAIKCKLKFHVTALASQDCLVVLTNNVPCVEQSRDSRGRSNV